MYSDPYLYFSGKHSFDTKPTKAGGKGTLVLELGRRILGKSTAVDT